MGKPPTLEKKTKKSREKMAKSAPETKISKKTAKNTPEKAPSKKTVKKNSKMLTAGAVAERDGGSSSVAADIADGDAHSGSYSASLWLPMSRVWRLVRGEGVNANITARTTPDVIFLINKASEMFLETLVEDTYLTSKKVHRKTVHYNDLALNVNNKKRYEFLSDFVPEKISAEDAVKAQTTTKT